MTAYSDKEEAFNELLWYHTHDTHTTHTHTISSHNYRRDRLQLHVEDALKDAGGTVMAHLTCLGNAW
jgi:hypothetical protein